MSIIRALFYRLPCAGNIYRDANLDPFESEYLVVKDVKEGFVQYRLVWRRGTKITIGSLHSRPRWLFHLDCVKVTSAAEWAMVASAVARVTGETNP